MGSRMGEGLPKQFLLLRDSPILLYTLNVFLNSFPDLEIVLALPGDYIERGAEIARLSDFPGRIKLAQGGGTRFHSVKNALALVPADAIVFVHDGVRCLVTPGLIHRCYEAALEKGNAVPAVYPVDSIRIEESGGNRTIGRERIRIIQTPQTFGAAILKKGFQQEYQDLFTDEATVVEQLGVQINLVEGEHTNIKITRPADLALAAEILRERVVR